MLNGYIKIHGINHTNIVIIIVVRIHAQVVSEVESIRWVPECIMKRKLTQWFISKQKHNQQEIYTRQKYQL